MPTVTTPIVGQKCKLYRNTGTVAVPVWDALDSIGDVAVAGFTMGMAQLKRRGNQWTKNLATLMDAFTVEGKIVAHMDATTYAAFKTNVLAGTAEEYAVMDGDITASGVQGMRCPLIIQDFPTDQAQDQVMSHDMKWALGYYESPSGTEIDPSFYIVP